VRVIRDILGDGGPRQKVVVFAHHIEVIDALHAAFPGGLSVRINGTTPADERQAAVEAFQHNPACRVFVGSIRTAGQGITLTAASRVLFVELDYSPMVLLQAEDRCHRFGQTERLLVQYLMVKGSLDERLGGIVASKIEKMQPLYQSASVAQLPAHERQPETLHAHIEEVSARAAEAREAYEAAKAIRLAKRAEFARRVGSSEEATKEALEKAALEAEKARSLVMKREARARERLEQQIEDEVAKERLALEARLEARAAQRRSEFEALASSKQHEASQSEEEQYDAVQAEFEASLRQHEAEHEAILRACEDGVQEALKELKRWERQAKALGGSSESSKKAGEAAARGPPAAAGADGADDGSHDEDFGESPPRERDDDDDDGGGGGGDGDDDHGS
jgi:flagellar biosynthesis GTPase FlhF